MKKFQPTESELLERGFTDCENNRYSKEISKFLTKIEHYSFSNKWIIKLDYDSESIYPTSWEDIDAIIRIFTPKD